MKVTPYSKRYLNEFVSANHENGKLISYLDLKDDNLVAIPYEDLPRHEVKGYPFASDFIDKEGNAYSYQQYQRLDENKKKECKLRYLFLPKYHELYIGTTGSGKTTGAMEPQLRAISSIKNKPNLFITDPKGELFEHNAAHLVKMGYKLHILNFKDVGRSDRWNPLEQIYDEYQAIKKIGHGYKITQGPLPKGVALFEEKEPLGENYIVYEGYAFNSDKKFEEYVQLQKTLAESKVSQLINAVANTMIPSKNQKDPVWELGARGLLIGIIMAMLEESENRANPLTREMMTIKTVADIFAVIRDGSNRISPLMERRLENFMRGKSQQVKNKVNNVLNTADVTRKGFLSTFEYTIIAWTQGHIFELTSGTTIDISDDSKPFAIFMATRDYEKSDYQIAALFIDWVYRRCLLKAEEKGRDQNNEPLTRDVHFLLDEFANIPMIPDFPNKIATSRSRKLWFHLFIQSYDQLDLVYEKEAAAIICDNCNVQSFLGSQSINTKKRFSQECGTTTRLSYSSSLGGGNSPQLEEVKVVQISDLDLIKPGDIYTKRIYSPVISSTFVRSYFAAKEGIYEDFYIPGVFTKFAPLNLVSYNDQPHTFEKIAGPYQKKTSSTLRANRRAIASEEDDED